MREKDQKTSEEDNRMQYAIEMYFDKDSENKIMELIQKVADAGISRKFLEWKTRPHVTLACFNDVDEDRCRELLDMFVQSHKKMKAHLDSVGMFTDTKTIFVSPMMSRKLYDLQADLHKIMNEFDTNGWEWYCPDNWVPHCTLALTREDEAHVFYEASNLILYEFDKICGTYFSIGLTKITFPVEEIYTVELS